jgi:hypothetical protein
MHRMQRVRRLDVVLLAGLVIVLKSVFLGELGLAQEQMLLDLTVPGPEQEGSRGVPGGRAGAGPLASGRYSVPLRLELVEVQPRSVGRGERLLLEIEITNTGSIAFDVPASRDFIGIHHPANVEQRQAYLFLLIEDAGEHGDSREIFAALAGSPSVPDSLLRLDPGGRVRIRAYGNLDAFRRDRQLRTNAQSVTIRAGYREFTLDANYVKGDISDEILSGESVEIVLRGGIDR